MMMMRFGVFVKWFFQIPPSMAVIIAIKASSSSAAVVLLYEISCIFLSPFYAFSFGKKNKSKKTRLKNYGKNSILGKKWRILIVVTFFFPILTFLDFSSSCRSLENMFYFLFLQMVEMDGRDGASERKPWMAREFSCPF